MQNIFKLILHNYQQFEQRDNIIMLFIDAKDIKFSSAVECVNAVNSLNENNASIFIFCSDEKIKKKKIHSLQSFLSGLNEGYFFHFQNYQQLREILVNLSTKKHQTNYFRFDYDFYNHNF